jgi:hypothetical protein
MKVFKVGFYNLELTFYGFNFYFGNQEKLKIAQKPIFSKFLIMVFQIEKFKEF